MSGDADTRVTREDAEWVVCQGFACVWVKATSPEAAIEIAAKRLGHTGILIEREDTGMLIFRSELS